MSENPYAALKTIFHEPNRMAMMSALCSAASGLTFTELKTECGLTDGNLSRHLKALEEAGAVAIRKTCVGAKPCTRVRLSTLGKQRFVEYLTALEDVLQMAAASMEASETRMSDDGALLGEVLGT